MKKIWIINHYATKMPDEKSGRHYIFSKFLKSHGYDVTIFCSNVFHGENRKVDLNGELYKTSYTDYSRIIFVKSSMYKKNNLRRIFNMLSFYKNSKKTMMKLIRNNDKPDVIIASSVHPLTLLAGIKIGKKHNIPIISEIRDLWPESLVAYNITNNKNHFLKLLYIGERWLYVKSDKLIFTMEGCKEYIKNKKWDIENGGKIELEKVHYINNGIDLETYQYNKEIFQLNDSILNSEKFKVVYIGSIRKVNQVSILLDVAEEVLKSNDFEFIIFGDGNEKELLIESAKARGLVNVFFMGRVENKFIPYILSKSNLNIILGTSNSVLKYGLSANKLFDYIASGKPIIQTFQTGYSILEKYQLGCEIKTLNSSAITNELIKFKNFSKDDYCEIYKRSRVAITEFDYRNLTSELVAIIESLINPKEDLFNDNM
jgi:glycosyltransferase involved in cell wall biosynthesis